MPLVMVCLLGWPSASPSGVISASLLVVLEADLCLPLPAPAQTPGIAARRLPPFHPGTQRVDVAPHKVTVCCFQGEESERGVPALQPYILALGQLTVSVTSVVTRLPAESEVICSLIYVGIHVYLYF